MGAFDYYCCVYRFLALSVHKYVSDLKLNQAQLTILAGGVIVFGVGLEIDRSVCTSAIYLCIVFYGTSKALIYAFLSALLALPSATSHTKVLR